MRQPGVEQQQLLLIFRQAGPELREHRVGETGVGEFEAQGILLVQTPSNSVRCFTVAESFQELKDGDQGEPPG